MLHVSKIVTVAERKDVQGKPVVFAFKAVTLKGELIEGENCVLTSSNNALRTVNIRFLLSGEVRKLHLFSFIEFNGQEVFL